MDKHHQHSYDLKDESLYDPRCITATNWQYGQDI